jgi:hypothetical protein
MLRYLSRLTVRSSVSVLLFWWFFGGGERLERARGWRRAAAAREGVREGRKNRARARPGRGRISRARWLGRSRGWFRASLAPSGIGREGLGVRGRAEDVCQPGKLERGRRSQRERRRGRKNQATHHRPCPQRRRWRGGPWWRRWARARPRTVRIGRGREGVGGGEEVSKRGWAEPPPHACARPSVRPIARASDGPDPAYSRPSGPLKLTATALGAATAPATSAEAEALVADAAEGVATGTIAPVRRSTATPREVAAWREAILW